MTRTSYYKDLTADYSRAVPVAADITLPKMETVLSKKIRGVPVNTFNQIVWSDTMSDKSFYGSWLGSGNCGLCLSASRSISAQLTNAVGNFFSNCIAFIDYCFN